MSENLLPPPPTTETPANLPPPINLTNEIVVPSPADRLGLKDGEFNVHRTSGNIEQGWTVHQVGTDEKNGVERRFVVISKPKLDSDGNQLLNDAGEPLYEVKDMLVDNLLSMQTVDAVEIGEVTDAEQALEEIGAAAVKSEVEIEGDPDGTLNGEEVDTLEQQNNIQELNDNAEVEAADSVEKTEAEEVALSEMIQDFEASIVGDRSLKHVIEGMYSVTDYVSERARSIQNGEVGFGGALDSVRLLQSRLRNYDVRGLNDQEERVKTRRLIDNAQEILTIAFNKEKELHKEVEGLQEDGPFTKTVGSLNELLHKEQVAQKVEDEEQGLLETQFVETGANLLSSLDEFYQASKNVSLNAGQEQSVEVNRMLGRLNEVMASGQMHPNDFEFASQILRNLTGLIENQQSNLQGLIYKTDQVPQLVNRLSKVLVANKNR